MDHLRGVGQKKIERIRDCDRRGDHQPTLEAASAIEQLVH